MQSALVNFLKFRSFITHTIVKILFWIYVILTLLAYPIVVVGAAVQEGIGAGLIAIIAGGIGVALAVLIGRIYAELVIVIFGIHDELKRMNDRQDAQYPR